MIQRRFCGDCGAALSASDARPDGESVCRNCDWAGVVAADNVPTKTDVPSDEAFFEGYDHAQESRRNEFERQTRGGIVIVRKPEHRAG